EKECYKRRSNDRSTHVCNGPRLKPQKHRRHIRHKKGDENMRIIAAGLVLLCSVLCVSAQGTTPVSSLNEKRVSLTEPAIALDASGVSALEATLRTTALNGAP